MTTKLFCAVCLIAGFSVASFGQGFTSLDGVAYCRGKDSIQLEVYYSIIQKLLPFTHSDSKWSAPINGSIEVLQGGTRVISQDIHKTRAFTGSQDEFNQHLADNVMDAGFFFLASKPNTEIVLILNGLIDSKQTSFSDTIRRHIEIPSTDKSKIRFGGIEFASALDKTEDKNSIFNKAGYNVIPNPSRIFGDNYTKLYYYSELYFPSVPAVGAQDMELRLRILDAAGEHEMYKQSQMLHITSDIVPILGSAQIDGLASDSYTLELTLLNGGVMQAQARWMFYYDSGIQLSNDDEQQQASAALQDENSIYLTSDFSKMTEVELDDRSAQTLYTATELQKKEYGKLANIDAKRRWLFDYWRSRDKTIPNIQPLATYRALLKRVDDANRLYTVMKLAGWKTSRGRIYIKFGAPDRFEEHRFDIPTRPYIIWEYTNLKIPLQDGSSAQYVFIDRQGSGDFVLISSNVRGETEETDWYTRDAVRTTGY